jgi:hypothetical protein
VVLGGYKFTWTMSGSGAGASLDAGQSFLSAYSGASSVGATNFAMAGWSAPATNTTGAVTTTAANSLVVVGFLNYQQSAHITPHAGSTYRVRYRQSKAVMSGASLILADELKATAGVYASQSVDLKQTDASTTFNGGVMGFALVLNP